MVRSHREPLAIGVELHVERRYRSRGQGKLDSTDFLAGRRIPNAQRRLGALAIVVVDNRGDKLAAGAEGGRAMWELSEWLCRRKQTESGSESAAAVVEIVPFP